MFYYFLYPLGEEVALFNVFKYITFRAVGASVTAFLLSLLLGPLVIRWLSRMGVVNATRREYADKIHSFYASKESVPTMGGILIVGSILAANLLWGNLENKYMILSLLVVLWFGIIGFVDDWLKVKMEKAPAEKARQPIARPSSPSVRLSAFEEPTITSKIKGMNQMPSGSMTFLRNGI